MPSGLRSILVVAADDASRAFYLDSLRAFGFPAMGANSGVDAVDVLHGPAAIALVLLDDGLTMAGWLQVVRATQTDHALGHIAACVVTGHPQVRAIARQLRVRVLEKPVSPIDLQRVAAMHLWEHGARVSAGRPRVPRLLLH